jgi:ubiquinone/menaquinone biosynthesis C-methylase UbiE
MSRGEIEAAVRDAYGASARAWAGTPARFYRRLGDALVAAAGDGALRGAFVLDVGAGTGVVTAAALAAGASAVVGTDLALEMLQHDAAARGAGVVADVLALPFAVGAFDAVVAGCVLNHLATPTAAVREMLRVTRPGGVVLASTFLDGPSPVFKEVIDDVLAHYGFVEPAWHVAMKDEREPLTATAENLRRVAHDAGCADVDVVEQPVDSGLRTAADVVDLRLGMASCAPFYDSLDAAVQVEVRDAAIEAVGPSEDSYVADLLVLVARVT